MTKRMIDGKIRKSQTFQKLTYRQRDLWQGLIEVADDQGRLPGNTPNVRSLIWPADDIGLNEVEKDLSVLISAGNIIRYELNGCEYIQITNWHKYQGDAEWLGLSEYPKPEGWHDRARFHGKNRSILTLNWGDILDDVLYITILDKETGQKVSLPYALPYPLPTPLPFNDGDGDSEVNVNGDVNGEGDVKHKPAKKRAGKQPESDPLSKHPAILCFRGITSKYPSRIQYDDVISILGDLPDGERAARAYKEWDARGYNRNSIKWLEWYKDGIPTRAVIPAQKQFQKVTNFDRNLEIMKQRQEQRNGAT